MFQTRLADAADRCGLAPGARLAVATSGGVDSTVLFRSLHALGFDAVAIYVHHGLRAEADDEAAFVRATAREVGAEARVVCVSVGEGNRQAAAREARYAALEEAALGLGCGAVVTGHTATDQAETVLMALVRGAGLRGLSGMAPARALGAATLVRPLLWATRAEVLTEARVHGWPWREDDSNATDRYRRNRIRRHVLPLLDAEGGAHTAARIAQAADTVRASVESSATHALAHLAPTGIPLAALRALPRADASAVFAEALRLSGAPCSQAVVARLVALVEAPPGERVGLGETTVWRDRNSIRLVMKVEGVEPTPVASAVTEAPAGRLFRARLGAVPASFPASRLTEIVDAQALAEPFVLRRWAPGDRMTPVGGSTRRVADLLAGVEPSRRTEALVLASGTRIVWLVGHRLSEHARVTSETAHAERLDWCPA